MYSLFDFSVVANMDDNSYVVSFKNADVDIRWTEDDKVIITIEEPVRNKHKS